MSSSVESSPTGRPCFLTVDGKRLEVDRGTYLLEAARRAGIAIPTLCHHEAVEAWGGCRLCLVEITKTSWDGWSKLVTACLYPAEPDLIVKTGSPRVLAARRVVLDLLLARCPEAPLIQRLAAEHGIETTSYRPTPPEKRDDCILCGLCTRICDAIGCSAISSASRGAGREIAPPFHGPPPDCIGCLACALSCPTQCIAYEQKDGVRHIWQAEFEMVRCGCYGEPQLTKAQVAHYARRSGLPESYFGTCDRCKKADTARKLEEVRAAMR